MASNIRIGVQQLVIIGFFAAGVAVLAQDKDQFLYPSFPDGHEWSDYHAVFQGPYYDAYLPKIPGRGLIVHPKTGGEVIEGRPLVFCNWGVNYHVPETRTNPARRVIELEGRNLQPQQNSRKVELQGKLQDKAGPDKSIVDFKLSYEFQGGNITFWWGIEDPRDVKHGSRIHISSSVPPSHNIPATMTMDERQEMLRKHELQAFSVKDNRKRRLQHSYSEILKFENPLERVIIVGQWAPRTVEFSTRDTRINGSIYQGNCPWQGYSFHTGSGSMRMNRQRARLTLTVK